MNTLHHLLGTKYILSVNQIKDLGRGNLFIATHNYEHIDLFILLNEIENTQLPFVVVVYDAWWNHLLDLYLHKFSRNKHIEFLFVGGKNKNNTKKIIDNLKQRKNVLIYIYRNNPAKGIYYIVNDVKTNIYAINISAENIKMAPCSGAFETFINNLNNEYKVDINLINDDINCISNLQPEEFMARVKQIIYKSENIL